MWRVPLSRRVHAGSVDRKRSDRSDGGVLVGGASPALGWRLPKGLRTLLGASAPRAPVRSAFAAAHSAGARGLGWAPSDEHAAVADHMKRPVPPARCHEA